MPHHNKHTPAPVLAHELRGKRFGLVLSAGYFGFFGHAGFVSALSRAGLTPAACAGTSAGGLIAALCAAGAPIDEIKRLLFDRRRDDFWDPDVLGIALDAVRRGPRSTGLLKGERLRALLARHLPQQTFERCRAPLVIVATNLSTSAPLAITQGDLPSAVHATCAYPGLFQAVRRDGHLLWDGGLVDKAPALALADAVNDLDALLVHYLPSRDTGAEPSGPLAYVSGMAVGMAALRREQFRLQLEVLKARGLPAYVITSSLPRVSPNQLHRGKDAFDAAFTLAGDALQQPVAAWQP